MFINQILTKLKSLVYSKSETDSLLNGKASSSHTHTKSQITDFPTIPSNVSQLTNDSGFITSSGSCASSGQVSTSVADGSSKDLVYATMAGSDYCRISCGGSSDAGYLEIATGDNGDDPIYVRQYPWGSNESPRTLTLLDESGNTQFPGTVTAPTFSGNLNGNCSGTAGSVAWGNVSGKPSAFTPSSHTHTKSQITDFPSLAIVATSGSYNDLSNKPTIRNDILHYAAVNSLDADTISEDGIWYVAGAITGAPLQNHGVFLNVKTMGTPFQMYFPDDLLYVYKRIYTSGAWGSWEKMNARSWDDIQSKPTIPTDTNQLTNGAGYITSSGSCNYANSAGYADSATSARSLHTYVAEGSSEDLLYATMARDDYCRISCGGSSDAGYLEIATGDGASEPIYVRQYPWESNSSPRTLTLLDESGNTQFPGTVHVPTDIVNYSDSRLKNSVTNIDDALLDAWENIEPKQYKFNDATEEKGDKARYHTGYLAQDIQTECEKQGVNASDYGLFCYDEWDEQEEISEEIEKEKDGKIVKEKRIMRPKREKGDRYSLRYAEALVVECKYLRRENSRLKENLASIEERLEKLEKAENS